MVKNIHIRKGRLEDLDSIVQLFVKATDKLIQLKIDQWNYQYPVEDDILKDLDAGTNWVYCLENKAVGVVSLDLQQDAQYQNIKWIYDGKVGVIHRMGVHPDFQGRGIGKALIRHLFTYAKNDMNLDTLRLDAYIKNPYSNGLYQYMGFTKAEGFCYFHGKETPFVCWEYDLNS